MKRVLIIGWLITMLAWVGMTILQAEVMIHQVMGGLVLVTIAVLGYVTIKNSQSSCQESTKVIVLEESISEGPVSGPTTLPNPMSVLLQTTMDANLDSLNLLHGLDQALKPVALKLGMNKDELERLASERIGFAYLLQVAWFIRDRVCQTTSDHTLEKT